MKYQELVGKDLAQFEQYLKEYFTLLPRENVEGIKRLLESVEYSILDGGKRFRPMLAALTVEALGEKTNLAWPYALALEMVHTYSLIHDDLPLMDNDDTRRGKPTNHKVYGDAMALLAGDALLTEAFAVIANGYRDTPDLALELVRTLTRAAGLRGMVGGQAIDIIPDKGTKEEWQIRYQHNLKTGALIRAAISGAAVIGSASEEENQTLEEFGKSLGLAFQIADDLQDFEPGKEEATSFVTVLGKDSTQELLKEISDQALAALTVTALEKTRLAKMISYNLERAQVGDK